MTHVQETDFSQGKMSAVITRMAIPLITAQLINILYNIVDRMYIGHIPKEGSLALTGLGLALPVISLVTAFTNLCAGGVPLCSIARGRGDIRGAERIMGNSLTLLLIFSVLITAALLVFMEPLLFLFGASDATLPYARDYLVIYSCGTIFAMLSLGMNGFISAQGFAKMSMLTVAVGAVVNIILDPVFIFVLDMDIQGAAIATVIAQLCSAVWVLLFLRSKTAVLELRSADLRLCRKTTGRILTMGTTGFCMGFTNSLVQTLCNKVLLFWGGDLYVGVMTVLNSIREVLLMPVRGMNTGAQPVLGFNYGAGENGRVCSGIKFVSIVSACYAFVAWLAVMLLPELLVKIFNNEDALVKAAAPALQLYFCGFALLSMQFAGQSVFVGLGKSREAIIFSLLRKVVIVVPLILFLPHVRDMGVDGVFLSEPVSDLLGGGACYLTMALTIWRPLMRRAAHDRDLQK